MKRKKGILLKTYLRHRIENVIDIKELFALEYLDFGGKYRDYSEAHEFWELCYLEEGELFIITDLGEISLSAGEMALIPPSRRHSYREKIRAKAYVICFESNSSALKSLSGERFSLNEEQKRALEIIIREAEGTFKMNKLDQLEELGPALFGGQQAIIAQLEYLFILTIRLLSDGKNSSIILLGNDDFYGDLVNVLLRFFRENVRNRLTLDDICAKVNYSRSFLCRTFKSQTGKSLVACFNEMKIEEAKRMLEETNLSVLKISAELGFSDPKYFSLLFKKQEGSTPLQYRNSKKGEREW